MATGGGTPVDGAVIIAHHIVLNLLEVRVMAYASDAFDTHLGEVIAHGEQLILTEHKIRRIDLDILRLATGETTLHQAQGRADKDPCMAKAIDATFRGTEGIGDGDIAVFADGGLEQHIASLEDHGHLVDNLSMDIKGIGAL